MAKHDIGSSDHLTPLDIIETLSGQNFDALVGDIAASLVEAFRVNPEACTDPKLIESFLRLGAWRGSVDSKTTSLYDLYLQLVIGTHAIARAHEFVKSNAPQWAGGTPAEEAIMSILLQSRTHQITLWAVAAERYLAYCYIDTGADSERVEAYGDTPRGAVLALHEKVKAFRPWYQRFMANCEAALRRYDADGRAYRDYINRQTGSATVTAQEMK